jgi:hypothetical protein
MKKHRPLITVFAVTALGFAACDETKEEEPSRAPPEGTYTAGPRVESVARGFDGLWTVDKDGNKRVVADSTQFPFTVSNLNDLSVEPGGKTLLVTEMGPSSQMRPTGSTNTLHPVNSAEAQAMPQTARVFRVNVEDGTVTTVLNASTDNRIFNGVFASKSGKILIADYFGGDLTELANNQQRTFAVPRGVDGIGEDKSGNLYLGVFEEGRVYRTDSNGGDSTVVVDGLGFRGVADIFVDADNGLLSTPNLGAGTLIVQKLP